MLTRNLGTLAVGLGFGLAMSGCRGAAPEAEKQAAPAVLEQAPPAAVEPTAAPSAAAADAMNRELADQAQRLSNAAAPSQQPAAAPPGPAYPSKASSRPPPSPQGAGVRATAPPMTGAVIAQAPRIAIDPNGRFATTYRPGGGHLAAFESAVARGIIPAAEREVVSDVGARYVSAFTVPTGKAMAVQTTLSRALLPPSGGPFHVRVDLRSSAQRPSERPHLSVNLVLDVSGSMEGESIARAREAASALVDKLAPSDSFSLVTFSSDATTLVPSGPVGPRRTMIKKTIADVREGGGTNIGAGLALGYREASSASVPADVVRVVLLLSDGRANAGITSESALSKLALDAFQTGVQTSALGLGADYDGALMSAIAADGAGGYYYLRDAEQIASALSTEVDRRLDPVAAAVEVRVRLKKGVDLLRVYGSRRLAGEEAIRVRAQEVAADNQAAKRDNIARDRQDDAEGGMRFFMPVFARDDSHSLLFELSLPPGTGAASVATVELKYKDRLTKKNVIDELPVMVRFADSDAKSGASIDASVARTVQGFEAGESLNEAAAMIARGDRARAIALLEERQALLQRAAASLSEPLFLRDAARLGRLRGHAAGNDGLSEPLVLALMLETAGSSHLR